MYVADFKKLLFVISQFYKGGAEVSLLNLFKCLDKSKYEMIAESLEHFGTEPARAVMVGDRHFDIDGAKEAGVCSIGAAYGYGTEEELISAGADFIARSVSDISSFVFSRE